MFLYIGIGLVVVVALVLLVAAQRQSRHRRHAAAKAKAGAATSAPAPVMTPQTAIELEAQLKSAYEHQITVASEQLGVDLKATSGRLSEQVERLTTSVIEEELEGYQKTLEEVRKVATETMEQIHQSVEGQRVELRQNMEKELAEERQRLVAQFDTRMGDIVASYVAESLGGGVDLGSQLQYITQTLETNKEALKKDLLSGI